jgi:hypothetical protein
VRYNTAVITYFVIPAGATSGQRIVMDGVNGEIDLYNASNQLVGQWKPSGLSVFGGTPSVGQSIQILPNASDDANRTAIEFRQTTNGGASIIDTNNDGSGRAQLNLFGPVLNNSGGAPVSWSCQLHNGFAELVGVEATTGANPGALHGGAVVCQDTTGMLACYTVSGVQTVQSSVTCNGASSPLVQITPDASRSGAGVTPNMNVVYNTRVTSAIVQIAGVGVWVALSLLNGYTAGSPAPSITLLPDGTLAIRGTLTTRAAPVSGDVCMAGPTNLVPIATRALLVFTLLNPNTVLQLNFNTNGQFQLFGGGPNPPATTGVSLDCIPPIPVAF